MEFVFGPVPSRRLGLSLGINIVPYKVCSFDCLYCEVGKTTTLTTARTSFFKLNNFLEVVKEKYKHFKNNIEVVTITGAGEPTLNSDLFNIITELKKFITHPLAILTNSSLIYDKQIQTDLRQFDIVVPSLDAVSKSTFFKINKPHNKINIEKIINGFIEFSNSYNGILYPEILVLKGINDTKDELNKIADILKQCKYTKIHLNTAFRPGAYSEAKALNDNELLEIALYLKELGLKIEPASKFISSLSVKSPGMLRYNVLTLLNMRPCTLNEISDIFGVDNSKISEILSFYIKKKMVIKRIHHSVEFYSAIDKND